MDVYMSDFAEAVKLASEYGLGVFLSVFLCFAVIMIMRKVSASQARHEGHLFDIIKEREEGIADEIRNLRLSLNRMSHDLSDIDGNLKVVVQNLISLRDANKRITDFFDN